MDDKNKYNNALKKLQEALAPKNGCEISGLTRGCIEEIFPELKESEDERIRKELIRYFKGMNFVTQEGAEKATRWIAWLEKQKAIDVLDAEEREFADNVNSYRKDMDEFYKKGYDAGREAEKQTWLEKQEGCEHIKQSWYNEGFIDGKYSGVKEWTSNDDATLKELIDFLENKAAKLQHDLTRYANWLKIKLTPIEKQGNKPQGKSALEAIKEEKVDNANKSVLDFKASDYYVSKVDGKIHNVHNFNEPKFKVGNWYQCIKDFFGKGVTFDKNTAYYCAKEGCLQDEYGCHIAIDKNLYDNFKLWTIEDAKDGDVLAEDSCIFILKGLVNDFHATITYCTLFSDGEFHVSETLYFDVGSTRPATKEQRDTLMKAMTDAGWQFDFEKKELKKIELHDSDKVETKFNIGDWITDGYLHCKISDVLDDRYIVDTKFTKRSAIPFKRENEYHLWTIEDAKDGDILASNYGKPFIYNGNHNSRHVGAYCGISTENRFNVATEKCRWTANVNIRPATKDQRDILMNAINDDDYVFDFDKKELKKMIYLSAKHNSQPIRPTDE